MTARRPKVPGESSGMNKLTHIVIGIGFAVLAGSAQAGGDIAAGKAKAATCVACHCEDGNSPTSGFPRLAGQHADYLEHALAGYANGERKNAIMAGFAATLSAQDRADLAAWFAAQPTGVYSIDGTKLY